MVHFLLLRISRLMQAHTDDSNSLLSSNDRLLAIDNDLDLLNEFLKAVLREDLEDDSLEFVVREADERATRALDGFGFEFGLG